MDTVKIPLSSLRAGERGRVASLNLEGEMRRRVQEMGLVEDTEISCLRHAPAGSPGAYRFRGAVVALRKCDAQNIEVSLWG